MNAPTHDHSLHAQYAPSSAHRWMNCTASAEAIAHYFRAVGEPEEGEAAAEGTQAHEEIERCLGPLDGHTPDWSTNGIIYDMQPVDPDHPAAYGVALVLDYVRKLPPGVLWVERRVRLTDEIWGRCDVAHWHAESRVLTIVDYKNGFVPVDAEGNEQLQIYAAGSIMTHGLPAEHVRLVVVQPNDFRPVPRVKQHVMHVSELRLFAERAAAVPHGPKIFTAGENCEYCPLFGICDASKDVLAALQVAMVNPADQVPAHQLAKFLACKAPVDDWFKGAEKAGLKVALSGSVPPGMTVVTGTKHQQWKDPAAARALVVASKAMPSVPAEYREHVNTGEWHHVPAEVVAAYFTDGVDALDPPTPSQAKKLGIDIEGLAEAPPGGPILAFEGDRRKPWAPKSAAEMFAGVVPPK